MRYFEILALTATVVAGRGFLRQEMSPMETEFYQFINKFGRSYKDKAEFEERLAIFKKHHELITEHNSQGRRYKMGINQFSDLKDEEFEALLGNFQMDSSMIDEKKIKKLELPEDAPKSHDWRDHGAVTGIKDQGSCGGCWSFSTTGGIEGAYFLKFGELLSFSEQQFLDCSHELGNNGCHGGYVIGAYTYAQSTPIALESDYKFQMKTGRSCHDTEHTGIITLDDAHFVHPRDQYALQAAVLQQPISISLQADQPPFRYYSGGILDDESCGGEQLNHAILLVGYGEEDGTPFWIMKNQWDTTWGEDGYARILRTDGMGICGIQRQNPYPIIN